MTENLPIKHRYLLSKAGNIRLRYVIACALVISALVGMGIFGGSYPSEATMHPDVKLSQMDEDMMKVIEPAAGNQANSLSARLGFVTYDPEVAGQGMGPFYSRLGKRPALDPDYLWTRTIEVGKGDTLGTLMEETGLSGQDYFAGMKAIKAYVDPQAIRPGHTVEVKFTRSPDGEHVQQVAYIYDSLTSVVLDQNSSGEWIAEKHETPLEVRTYAATTTIENSLFLDLGRQGVPDGIINRMIQAYSWSVDFQRDIWGGEEVELLYETRENEDGSFVRSNRLLYAKLSLRNKELPIYLFEKKDGTQNYFEPNGQSIRRALMKTPVDGARLSSGFGMRKHPVLGYNKMHRGLDFAAPTGTPIYAAGDGTIERASRFGSYGNYIRIRHNNNYKTAYAHLHGYAKGIRAGKRVKQGQVIGYVGTTGRSTGPHLHYEVHKNGQKVNPHSVDLPLGEKLNGTNLANFKITVDRINGQYASLIENTPKVAKSEF